MDGKDLEPGQYKGAAMSNYQRPRVYREEIFVKPVAALLTGVPGFAGFADAGSPAAVNQPVALYRKEEFSINFLESKGTSYLADAVNGFFDNGGSCCYVVRADDTSVDRKEALREAVAALTPYTDIDLVAVPDAMVLPTTDDVQEAQRAVLTHCADTGRFAVLDAIGGSVNPASQRDSLLAGQEEPVNGALYAPWIKTADGNMIPPCGHIAGIYARTDGKAGVHKPPANEEVRGIVDMETQIDEDMLNELNAAGVNCLRAFPGRGIRVCGGRTLSRDTNWQYVNVRRIVLTLARWIDSNLAWAAFEPNTPGYGCASSGS